MHLARSSIALIAAAAASISACTPIPRPFDPPAKTAWKPEGCRTVPADDPVVGSRDRWRTLHADLTGSDEVGIALAPVFEPEWVAEPLTYNVTGPVFDKDGNLYFAPLLPGEEVILVSLDPTDGSRRWAVPGTGAGGGAPLVLGDPDHPGEDLIYLGIKDRAIAVRPDGAIVWDVPTGVARTGSLAEDATFGVSYHPDADAIVGLTGDGRIYPLDRATGAPLLDEPFSLPGEKSPPSDTFDGLSPALRAAISAAVLDEIGPLVGALAPDADVFEIIEVLLGGETEVANYFSIDPHTGRIWVAATAPDAADGTADGVSAFGALYGLDLVASGGGFEIAQACARFFEGGSASTPSLSADGERVYVADATGNLIAIDRECHDLWTLDVGGQIGGSIGVSSDNGEIYASTAGNMLQVIDLGTEGMVRWEAGLWAMYWTGPVMQNVNLNLYSIAANGLGFMGGAGVGSGLFGAPVKVGVGVLDRDTGAVRYFVDGFEETVAVMSTGPDGAMYIGHSPVRRAVLRAFAGDVTAPLVGGIGKYAPRRLDLLVRDAACAAADRAANAATMAELCAPGTAEADIGQIGMLIRQARAAGPRAVADGDLAAGDWASLETSFTTAESLLTPATLPDATFHLANACDFFP